MVARYWFPLKYFISPVKNQGGRGTCWAFTAISAMLIAVTLLACYLQGRRATKVEPTISLRYE